MVTASYVMEKRRTGVFISVFCDARVSMELPRDKEWSHDNAVPLYFLEISKFTLVWEAKVFKNNVWNVYSVSPQKHVFIVIKASYVPIYTMLMA